jgi:bifunctional DNase/RNase
MEAEMGTERESPLVKMQIVDVRRLPTAGHQPRQYVVVLEEVGGARRLLIGVGPGEGEALALHVEQVPVPRPLTFTFMANLLQALGAQLHEARIDRLVADIFYAVAVVAGPTGIRTVDARPADVLNLALITGAPICVEPAVLTAATRPSDGSDER